MTKIPIIVGEEYWYVGRFAKKGSKQKTYGGRVPGKKIRIVAHEYEEGNADDDNLYHTRASGWYYWFVAINKDGSDSKAPWGRVDESRIRPLRGKRYGDETDEDVQKRDSARKQKAYFPAWL
jgi:hypothetical protein